MGHIIHFFGGVDLRCQHDGLNLICKQEKIDVKKLKPGEYVIFINHARDRVKLYTASDILAYLRVYTGKIDLRMIQYIPQAFESRGKIDYNQALKEFVEGNLLKKGKHEVLEAGKKSKIFKAAKKIKDLNKMSQEEIQALAGELVLTPPDKEEK